MSENVHLLLLLQSESGPLSPDDAAALAEWLKDPAHARLAREYKAIWEKSEVYQPEVPVDTTADFQRVWAKIEAQEAVKGRRISMRTWLRVAAALLVLLAAVGLFRSWDTGAGTLQTAMADASGAKALVLPDGTQVWLRANARLEYPEVFDAKTRIVHLKGEAIFDVAHADSHPFRVTLANGGSVEVLGTRFAIRQEAQGETVVVQRGKVRFQPVSGDKGVVLTAGERAQFDHATRRIQLSQALTYNELAWQTGGLEFINTPLRQVVADLQAFYHVKIELTNNKLNDCTLTAPLSNQPIDQLLETLSLTYQIKVEHPKPDTYVLKGGVCPD